MPLLFAVTLFVSASLLFMVQPMVGKMVLPLLGGSPAVWNACMVFFQALLLLGYLYAHWLSTRFEPKKQWAIHLLVLMGPVAAMVVSVAVGGKNTPIGVAESLAPSDETSPFLSVMALLTLAIGVPFFVSSTSAPLLQKWFAYTGHPSARDPYFLYAASNAGSLIALLGYPLFIEPNMIVAGQTWVWAVGFALLCGLIFLCGRAAANPIGVPPASVNLPGSGVGGSTEPAPTPGRIAKWIALAFVPSSLMLGVTFHMTTDIASIPLLWVIPLALYLVTFIIAFGRVPSWFRLVIGNLAPVMILLLVFVIVSRVSPGTGVELLLHISTFFVAALMCHYELARDRPKDVAHLTGYFLWMSVGGVLGGLFNALLAPLAFPLAYEYPITLAVACLLVPRLLVPEETDEPPTDLDRYKRKIGRILDYVLPVVVGAVFALLAIVFVEQAWFQKAIAWLSTNLTQNRLTVGTQTVRAILVFAVPVMVCFFFVDRPARFALSVAAILGVHYYHDRDDDVKYTERSFFGILKVEQRGYFTRLVHGTTLHGTQINEYYLHRADAPVPFGSFSPWDVIALEGALAAWDPKQEPLTYYHRTGPVGAMFHELRSRKNGADAKAHVAMVGLGTGSVSCYALPGQKLTFYEIDPAVKHLVADTDKYFTYVSDARRRGADLDFRMGDARLKLRDDADRKYALLLIDAFSSDAIPVHLLTKQAVELYLDRLTPDGILALHISNKYVRLDPVVAKIAAELRLTAYVWKDSSESRPGKTASSWVVLARDKATLGVLAAATDKQVLEFGTKNQALLELLRKYPATMNAKDAISKEWGGDELTPEEFSRRHGAQAGILLEDVRRHTLAKEEITLGRLTDRVYGAMFEPLKLVPEVALWTDDFQDVMQVMMIKEVQWLRKQVGLPTPGLDE